jgi:hypothetical protein
VPDPVSPRGPVAGDTLRFAWTAGGHSMGDGPAPDLYIVVLDEQLEEVERRRVEGGEFRPDAALLARLRTGDQFHWLLEAAIGGECHRSAPAAFQFSR